MINILYQEFKNIWLNYLFIYIIFVYIYNVSQLVLLFVYCNADEKCRKNEGMKVKYYLEEQTKKKKWHRVLMTQKPLNGKNYWCQTRSDFTMIQEAQTCTHDAE